MFVNSRWIKESRVLFLNLCHVMLYGLFLLMLYFAYYNFLQTFIINVCKLEMNKKIKSFVSKLVSRYALWAFLIDVIFCITQYLWLAQWFWRSWNVKIKFTDRWVNNRWSEKLTASVIWNLNWHLPLKIYLLNAKYILIPIYGF